MAAEQLPSLIVGAGGGGLAAALLLLQQDLPAVVVERHTEISWMPRARNINFRTLEVMRSLGIADQVHAAGTHASRMFRKDTVAAESGGAELLDPVELIEGLDRISPEPLLLYCPQSRLDPVMRTEILRRGGEIRYGCELVSFTQDADGVSALLADRATGATSTIRAGYLIAADGAHSRVRGALEVSTWGIGELPEVQIFVYFRADWQDFVAAYEGDAIMTTHPGGQGIFLVGVATDRHAGVFILSLDPREGRRAEDYTNERCRQIVATGLGIPAADVEVINTASWQAAQRLADQFQVGRVLLLGDAAHTMPPFLGLGVNTAIQSAQNLIWKLAAVLKGQASPALLATYHTERHPVGRLAAEQSLTGPAAALAAKVLGLHFGDHLNDPLPLLYPMAAFRYRSTAVLAEDPTPTSAHEYELLTGPEQFGLPGSRIPHLWIQRHGQPISTLDLIDGSFLLLATTPAWQQPADHVAALLGIPLQVYQLTAEQLRISPGAAMLVRPDGYVGWIAPTDDPDATASLLQALRHILGQELR
jgi:putative polyketide hydroxylase